MRLVDIVYQLVGDQRFIVNMHTQIPADVVTGRMGYRFARSTAALRGAVGHQISVTTCANVRSTHDELVNPVRVGDGHDHGRLSALGVADEVCALDAQRVHEGDSRPGLHGMYTLVIDDRSGLAEIGQVHEDASEVL